MKTQQVSKGRRPRQRFSPEQKAAALAMLAKGKKPKEVCAAIGLRSVSTLYVWKQKARGVLVQRTESVPARKTQEISTRANGSPAAEIFRAKQYLEEAKRRRTKQIQVSAIDSPYDDEFCLGQLALNELTRALTET